MGIVQMPLNKNRSKFKVTFMQKIALIMFGLFLFFLFLEAGLRLAGFINASLQEYKNSISIKRQGAYRIMCLGESTTVGQYPFYLEQILNQNNKGINFSVIDKGVAGTNTSAILANLESNLDAYHPNAVVTMMGINDGKLYVFYNSPHDPKIIRLLKTFRVYKFTKIICLSILNKLQEAGFLNGRGKQLPMPDLKKAHIGEEDIISNSDARRLSPCFNANGEGKYVELGEFYRKQGDYLQAEDAFKKARELNPNCEDIYIRFAELFRDKGEFLRAKRALNKVLELDPKNEAAYIRLAELYRTRGMLSQAEEVLRRFVELNPHSETAYIQLGRLYRDQSSEDLDKRMKAEEAFRKAIEVNPNSKGAYIGLGGLKKYNVSDFPQAEKLFQKAAELNPDSESAYLILGEFYRCLNNFSKAEEAFKKVLKLNPDNEVACGALLILYEETKRPELAKEFAAKVNNSRLGYYNPATANSYIKIKEILDRRGIKLVCVQYPMRSLEPLKKIFQGKEEDVIFVDNEKLFRNAVKNEGYKEYFIDIFGGDFGHCTDKGNKLLSENIAAAILNQVFQ
jgi:tetratricopeptide (TPR) repeat protein